MRGGGDRMDERRLGLACETLTRYRHCDAEWCVAYNGLGPHAWGITPGRKPNINLSADDAIRLAESYDRSTEDRCP